MAAISGQKNYFSPENWTQWTDLDDFGFQIHVFKHAEAEYITLKLQERFLDVFWYFYRNNLCQTNS